MKIFYMFLISVIITSSAFADLTQDLYLRDFWNIERTEDFVSGGIPIPKSLITDVNQIGIFDENGNAVPFQSKNLMLWPDGSLRWVLLTFPTNVTAQSTTKYRINFRYNQEIPQPGYAEGKTIVTEDANKITVSTGKLTFTVRKNNGFNIFDNVLIAKDSDGIVDDEIVSSSLLNGAKIWDQFDSTYTTGNAVALKIKIEEEGPLRTIIRIEGLHSNGNDDDKFYGFLTRIYAYAGKSYVHVQHSIKNSALIPRGVLAFNGMQLNLKTNVIASNVTLYGDSEYSSALTDSAYVYQSKEQSCKAVVGTAEIQTGSRALGWIDQSNTDWGVSVGIYEFASNCPNEVFVKNDGSIEARLFPKRYIQGSNIDIDWELDDYFIGMAEHKTHKICYYFHAGTAEEAKVANVMASFNHPMHPQTSKDWVARTRAIPGEIYPSLNPILEPATTSLPIINKSLSDSLYTGVNGTKNYYDSWCTFGEAKWRNDHGSMEIFENQGTRYYRNLDPITLRIFEANAWLYADFREYHIDSVVGIRASGYYKWLKNSANVKDSIHTGTLPNSHRWYAPELGSSTEHLNVRDLFMYYLTTGDLKIQEAMYEFAELQNNVGVWRSWGRTEPGTGYMNRAHGSSWATSWMVSVIENKDTVNGKCLQDWYLDWLHEISQGLGTSGKVGIFATMYDIGVWSNNSDKGPSVFFDAIVDMPFSWYLEYFWDDTLQPYLDKRIKGIRDTIIGENGGINYTGFRPTGVDDDPLLNSTSLYRLPGSMAQLYKLSGDTSYIRKVNLACMDGTNPRMFSKPDHDYFDRYDLTWAQSYMFYKDYLKSDSLFLLNPIIQWNATTEVAGINEFNKKEILTISASPNPFNPNTTIKVNLGNKIINASLKIFNASGKVVADLTKNLKGKKGIQNINWTATNLASGIYFVKINIDSKTILSTKLLLMK